MTPPPGIGGSPQKIITIGGKQYDTSTVSVQQNNKNLGNTSLFTIAEAGNKGNVQTFNMNMNRPVVEENKTESNPDLPGTNVRNTTLKKDDQLNFSYDPVNKDGEQVGNDSQYQISPQDTSVLNKAVYNADMSDGVQNFVPKGSQTVAVDDGGTGTAKVTGEGTNTSVNGKMANDEAAALFKMAATDQTIPEESTTIKTDVLQNRNVFLQ